MFSSILLGRKIVNKIINPIVCALLMSEGFLISQQHEMFLIPDFRSLIFNVFCIY